MNLFPSDDDNDDGHMMQAVTRFIHS